MQTAVSAPFLNTWCYSSFLTFYLNYLPLWSVSDDQKLERKKKKEQNKTNIPFWNAFRASLWPSFHYWKNCNQSNCNFCQRFFFFFLSYVSGWTFCVQPRHPRWRSFHFPHWKNSSGKFHRFRFFVLMYTLNQWYCKVLEQKFAFALVSLMHPRIKHQGLECLKRSFDVGGCLITLDWRCKQGVLNWENISNYLHLWNMFTYLFIYLFIHVFSHLFSHLLACNLTLCSFIANEILVHFLLFCHLVSLWLHFWETGL